MNDFIQTLLGEMPTGAFWAYFLLAIGGMVLAFWLQYLDSRKDIQASGGFQKSVWFIRNWPRLVFNPIAIFIGIVLHKELEGEDISKVGAIILGLASDLLVDRIKGITAIARGKK